MENEAGKVLWVVVMGISFAAGFKSLPCQLLPVWGKWFNLSKPRCSHLCKVDIITICSNNLLLYNKPSQQWFTAMTTFILPMNLWCRQGLEGIVSLLHLASAGMAWSWNHLKVRSLAHTPLRQLMLVVSSGLARHPRKERGIRREGGMEGEKEHTRWKMYCL